MAVAGDLKSQMKWIEPLARAGYAARGAIYLIIGFLIVAGGVAATGEQSSTKGAVETLMAQPFGRILVWLLVISLAGYIAWRLVQSFFDTDHHGAGLKGLGVRTALFVSALTYSTLAFYALSLLGVASGGGSGGGSGSGSVGGSWLNGIVANHYVSLGLSIIFAVVAGAHFYKAFKRKYADDLQAPPETMKVIDPVSITGLTARGAVFAILAVLTFYRFLNGQGSSTGDEPAPGLSEAISFLAGLPLGSLLLTLMGVGLIAFAAYSIIQSVYRRINWEDA